MSAPNRGFTLIELLVVIVIIGIISVVAFVNFSNFQKNSRDARRMADMKQAQNALEQFYAVNKGYPTWNNYPLNEYDGPDHHSGQIGIYFQNGAPSDPNKSEVGNYDYHYLNCRDNAPVDCAYDPLNPLACPWAKEYIICAKLVNPAGKANTNPLPNDPTPNGCGSIGVTSGTATYYCIKSTFK